VTDLRANDLVEMTTPTWDRAKDAIRAGDTEAALALVDTAVSQWRSLQEYSINWITSTLSFIAREMGEEAVERALRQTGDEFVRPRRSGGPPAGRPDGPPSTEWGELPARVRAKVIARAMLANFGECEVDEDEEKISLSFRCGTGGKLIDDGRYDEQGGAYHTLRENRPRTFSRDALPVYCAHCSVNNELQPLEWGGAPTSIEHPPTQPGERCVHHIYKDATSMPSTAYTRLGMTPPGEDAS
jgi:hypothetical protein